MCSYFVKGLPMQHGRMTLAFGAMTVLLAACGGGSGSGSAEAPAVQGLQDSDAVATALAAEAHGSVRTASRVPGPMGTAEVTGLVNVLAGGTTAAGRVTAACAAGGSISADLPSTLLGLGAGKTYNISFANCQQMPGMVTNGQISLSFSSLTNSNNFSETATYNITVTQNGSSTAFAGNQACTVVGGVASCTFSEGPRNFGGNFSNKDGVLNGSYSWAFGTSSSVNFDFSNWSSTGGSIAVSGTDRFRATVVRDGPSSYTITINGGTPRKVTVPG
jgi:hypothetical protein